MSKIILALLVCVLAVIFSCKKETDRENSVPSIQSITASPAQIIIGETSQITCVAVDSDGDRLTYTWSADAGSFNNSIGGNSTDWKSPGAPGSYSIKVEVSDGKGVVDKTIVVKVILPPGTVYGFVYFSGTKIPISGVTVKIGSLQTISSSVGMYELNAKLGEILIVAYKDGFDPYSKNSTVDGTSYFIIEMTSGSFSKKVFGSVKNEDSQSIAGIPVVILNPDGSDSKLQTTTDLNGYYQIPSVPMGKRDIVFKRVNPYIESKTTLTISNYDYSFYVVLINGSPIVDFNATPTIADKGKTIQFSDKSKNIPTSWLWAFGDGVNSSLRNPSHIYTTAGLFDVSLKASNSYGDNTKTVSDYILVSMVPVADFIAIPTAISQGQSVQFYDKSTNKPTSWLWNFGDGSSSTEQSPSHRYFKDGSFMVSLTVSNSFGDNTKKSASDYITVDKSVYDFEYNMYKTVIIGTQEWMAENLVSTLYNDGTPIPQVTNQNAWVGLSTPGFCWYDNDEANRPIYGALYNWFVINTSRLAPKGWHVATDEDWMLLTTFLGGAEIAGSKLKEAGTIHWLSPNNATNEFGFSARPGGCRYSDGNFSSLGYDGYWWSATEYNFTDAWTHNIFYNFNDVNRFNRSKTSGFSVRCVRDK